MSNTKNFFDKYKNGLTLFEKDTLTQEDIRSELLKKKEKQVAEHRKKMMKDIYMRMFSNKEQSQNNQNTISNNSNNNMEVEDDAFIIDNNKILNNNVNNYNDEENKKKLIQEYLNNEKKLYNDLGEEFIYQIIDDKKISFCPTCGYPVIIIDKNLSDKGKNNSEYVSIACVNSCFQFELNESVFNRYSMDNVMDLYVQALKKDNDCKHNDIRPITSGDDGVIFSCITCLFEQFK